MPYLRRLTIVPNKRRWRIVLSRHGTSTALWRLIEKRYALCLYCSWMIWWIRAVHLQLRRGCYARTASARYSLWRWRKQDTKDEYIAFIKHPGNSIVNGSVAGGKWSNFRGAANSGGIQTTRQISAGTTTRTRRPAWQ